MTRRTLMLAAATLTLFSAGWIASQVWHNNSDLAQADEKAKSGYGLKSMAATLADEEKRAGCADDASCDAESHTTATDAADHKLSTDERLVFEYMMGEITEKKKGAFQGAEIESATGVSTAHVNFTKVKSAIKDELAAMNFDTSCLTGASAGYCTKFSACSVDRNLNGASGEELAHYTEEKAQNGKTYTDWLAPDFTVPMTSGDDITLSTLRGHPVALTFLAMHCYHSMDTLPILRTLHETYAAQGVAFLPVFVNTTLEDVRELMISSNIEFPVGAAPDKSISNLYDSRMVPSAFLIDSRGYVTQRFVGYQNEEVLSTAYDKLATHVSMALNTTK